MDAQNALPTRPRRRWWVTALLIVAVPVLLAGGVLLAGDWVHRGPRSMPDVVAVMPGVPIFPLSTLAPGNATAQRLLAIPLRVLMARGARQADAALLHTPADSDFIVDWYRQAASTQHWVLVGQDRMGDSTRLLFQRETEGLQITVGRTAGLATPVQFIYMSGLTSQLRLQLHGEGPVRVRLDQVLGAPIDAGNTMARLNPVLHPPVPPVTVAAADKPPPQASAPNVPQPQTTPAPQPAPPAPRTISVPDTPATATRQHVQRSRRSHAPRTITRARRSARSTETTSAAPRRVPRRTEQTPADTPRRHMPRVEPPPASEPRIVMPAPPDSKLSVEKRQQSE